MDAWGKLWDLTEEGTTIEVTDHPGHVTLVFADGSRAGLTFYEGDWRFNEAINSCAGDVSARDTL